jgi:hypothetical protein
LSAATLTVVDAQTRNIPRWGRTTSVVFAAEVMLPVVAITAFPTLIERAPVTVVEASTGTIAMGVAAVEASPGMVVES